MGQVKLTNEFFRKEMLNYGNARQVLARELFQNSIDAGATRIDVDVRTTDDALNNPKNLTVSFSDNGCGMDRDTLENVFFALGKTTKNSSETIGGFGKARIVTCFGMDSYSIRTGSLYVTGCGADYEISEDLSQPIVNGTVFEIVVPLNVFGPTVKDFTRYLLDYLALCHIDCDIRINGVKWTTWTYRRKLVRRLTFADIHVNKSASYGLQNRMLIRVGGVLMYEKYIAANVLIVVEINPSVSRTVLLSNRDRLHYTFENELEKFAQEVAVNTTSALKTASVVKQTLPGHYRKFLPKQRRKFTTQLVQDDQKSDNQKSDDQKSGLVEIPAYTISSENIPSASKVDEYNFAASSEGLGLSDDLDDEKYNDPITEGMVFVNESSNSSIRKSAALYHPGKWTDGNGSRRRKLLAQWVVACEYALEEFCFLTGKRSVDWRWGWYFSDNARAACEHQSDNSYALMLNPVHGPSSSSKDIGTMRFAIREFDSHVSLVTLACHEVAHISETTHDEGFATLMTDLCSRTLRHIKEIHRDMIAA